MSGATFEEAFLNLKGFLQGAGRLNMFFSWPKLELPSQTGRFYGGYEIRTDGPSKVEVHPKEATLLQAQIFVSGALSADSLPRRQQAGGAGVLERIAALWPDGRAAMADS